MEAAWNNIQLERPPNTRWCIEAWKFDTNTFLASLDKIIKDLDSQEMLHTEATILSRLIYRMKSKFRNDKGLKAMSKVNRALLNYLSLSLDKEYKILKSYTAIDEGYANFPSKQMVEYVLVRTQGFAKLILRVEEVARHSAHFFKSRMNLGHAWSIAVVAYAVISRIWILSRYLIQKCCAWYTELYQYLKKFKTVGIEWLPKNYELPDNLKSWLALPWIDEAIPSVPSNQQFKDTIFKLIVPQESDLVLDLSLDRKRQDTESESVSTLLHHKETSVSSARISNDNTESIIPEDDTGEVVSRHNFNVKNAGIKDNTSTKGKKRKNVEMASQEDKQKKIIRTERVTERREQQVACTQDNRTKKQSTLAFDDITTKSDLMVILSKDSYLGLDKLQWNMLRNKCRKLVSKFDAQSDSKKQSALLKKAIQSILQVHVAAKECC